jgi:DNA-binding HxlR family transcriptional regulator
MQCCQSLHHQGSYAGKGEPFGYRYGISCVDRHIFGVSASATESKERHGNSRPKPSAVDAFTHFLDHSGNFDAQQHRQQRRHRAAVSALPQITQKVLIQQLREMEKHGLVTRQIFAEVPARVEYSATEVGLELEPVLLALCKRGQKHAEAQDEANDIADCIVRPRNGARLAA